MDGVLNLERELKRSEGTEERKVRTLSLLRAHGPAAAKDGTEIEELPLAVTLHALSVIFLGRKKIPVLRAGQGRPWQADRCRHRTAYASVLARSRQMRGQQTYSYTYRVVHAA